MSRSYTRMKKRRAAHQRREQATRARELDRRAVTREDYYRRQGLAPPS